MLISEIIPTRCNICVYSSQWLFSTYFNLCSLALLVFAIDTYIDIFRFESFLPADFVISDGRIRLIQLSLGVLVLVSQFCLLGVYELNICGSVHHA